MISFAAPDEGQQLKQIERYTGRQIERHVVEGMEPKVKQRTAAPGSARKPGYGGQRRSEPRRFSNGGNSSWSGGKSYGGNGARSSREGGFSGTRNRGRG